MTQHTAIVTGAGSGIGREVARQLAERGYRVTLVGRRKGPLLETIQEVDPALREGLFAHDADVSDETAAAGVVEATCERWGRVDALINNAAIVNDTPLPSVLKPAIDAEMAVNLYGPIWLIRAAWPHMVRQGAGCIVNVSSIATVDPFPGLGIYAASKAALESLTRSVAGEGGGSGIRAWAVAPGAVETSMLRSLVTAEVLPSDKTLLPADVAAVIVACVRGERPEESGSTIVLPSPQ